MANRATHARTSCAALLAQDASLQLQHHCSIMVLYCVYRATYTTRRGTRRAYIGYSGHLDVRKYWHKVKPPAWMKPQRDNTLDVVILDPQHKQT